MSDLVAYIDGGSIGNPGPSGIGVVIDGSTAGTIRIAKWIGRQDNNVAEYIALLEALQCALGLKAKALHVFSDSEVVVKQMSGEYSCHSPRLYSLNWICRKLARSLDFSISHVRRENKVEANGLATAAARKRLCSDQSYLACVVGVRGRAIQRRVDHRVGTTSHGAAVYVVADGVTHCVPVRLNLKVAGV